MKKFLFITFYIFTGYMSFSQDCESILLGSVIDYHDKTPLKRAIIQTLDGSKRVISDTNGKFKIYGLCDATYTFEISHPECSTVLLNIDVSGKTEIEIKLEHHLEELEEVEVVGEVLFDQTNSAQEATLNTKKLEKFSAATLGDALKQISGVSSLNTGANIVKPAIHGLNGSRVLILNDGVRMQDMEWGDEHAPNIDVNSAGSVTVVKGASALQYGGDAIGGVIVLAKNHIFKSDTLFGKTIVNGVFNGRGGSINSELTKSFEKGWFVTGQASYRRLGDQEAPDYILSNTGVKEFGGSVHFGKNALEWGWDANYTYYDAEIAILRASHIGNVDDLIRSINSGEPLVIRDFTYDLGNPRQKVRHHLGKLKFYKRFEGLGKWDLQYDFQSNRRFEFDVRRGERSDRASIDLELTTHTISSNFKWDANKKLNLHVGLLGRYQDNFANPDTGVRRLIPDYEKYDLGGFTIAEYRLGQNWVLDGGFRYDFTQIDAKKFYRISRWEERGYDEDFQDLVIEDRSDIGQLLVNPVFDYHNYSTTLGAQFSKDNTGSFRFNYALSQRAPNPAELFSDGLHHSAARIELGDLRLQSETSHKIALTETRDFRNWGFTVEPYANFINNFIILEPTGVEFTIRGAFPVWSYRQTNARLLGVDISSFINWNDFVSTNHQFALVKGKDLDLDIPLINIPSANFGNSISYKKPKWNNFQVNLRSNYVFRQNEFPANIEVFSPDGAVDVVLEINTPPPAYHLLGLDSQLEFSLGGKTNLTTSLTINNILNTNYREYLNRQRYFADDLGTNIILQLKINY
ncbi:TonB-dependent receptor [uncultured Croceitalea sp.]|uniref:TonB-dependent receptor n=1 Tax=uncultured Croceitalea sp. TaxID=1798908 RepID=UPI0033056217